MKLFKLISTLAIGLFYSCQLFAFATPQSEKTTVASRFALISIEAERGQADAQYLLGLMYITGRYVTADRTVGIEWLTKSANAGNEKSLQALADIYFDGSLVPQDIKKAEQWYTELAKTGGNKWAYFQLGLIYSAGADGVKRDCSKAVSYFIKVGDDTALGNAAWTLATCPDAKHRDGERAISIATEMLKKDEDNASYLDNLAAAYAETGEFGLAISTQQKALEAVTEENDDKLIGEFSKRLELYQQGKPYRETLALPNNMPK